MDNKDILNALADALMGTGSAKHPEPEQKWYVCVSDRQGSTKRYQVPTLRQAELTVRDWQLAGWAAWILDENGHPVVIAKRDSGIN